MCFSAPVSFAAGLLLTGVGAAALRAPLKPSEKPFACIPLLFGAQQLIEGMLWLLLPVESASLSIHVLVQLYVLFAGAVWPVLVPFSIFLTETSRPRRFLLGSLCVAGAAIAIYTASIVVSQGFTVGIANQCLTYGNPMGVLPGTLAVYAIVACAPFFVSSDPGIRWIGAAQVLGLAVAWTFYRNNLPSVWCLFAAIVSVLIYARFRENRRLADLGMVKSLAKAPHQVPFHAPHRPE
jgi:hypothetical protein